VVLAVFEHCLVLAVAGVVLVLDGGDLDHLAGGFELVDRDVRDADVSDFPLVLELREGVHRLLVVDVRIGAVELIQIDLVGPEAIEAAEDRVAEIARLATPRPRAVAVVAPEATLGCDERVVVGCERLADQAFGDRRAVGVGGVDEVDAEVGRALEDLPGFLLVVGWADDPLAGEPHCAEPQSMDRILAADVERVAPVFGCHRRHRRPTDSSLFRPRQSIGRFSDRSDRGEQPIGEDNSR